MLSRLKFEIEGLFQEIYDYRLPETLFMSETTTFADLQSAGLQSIIPLVNKLRKYGHSDENIRSRVFVFMENDLYLNYVQVKNADLPVTFYIYKESINMKFDVVVGNPPYQMNHSNSNKRAEKLWTKFIEKSHSLTKLNGYISLVTPTSWLSGSKNIKKGSYGVMDLFNENNLLTIVKGFVFPNVSVSTHYWVLQKNNNYQNTEVIDSVTNETFTIDIRNGFYPSDLDEVKTNIIQKIFNMESFEWLPATSMYTKWRKGATNEETIDNSIRTYVKGGNFENVQFAYFREECKPGLNSIKKVIVPLSGAEKFSPYIDINCEPFCCDSYVFPIKEENATIESVSSVFYSKLFKFLVQNYRTSGFVQYPVIKRLPKLDLSRMWTDEDIFNYVGLNDNEKVYINENL